MRLAFVLLPAVLLLAPGPGDATPVKPLMQWTGRVKDKDLLKLAPARGYLSHEKDLEKLWKAWDIKEKMPAVDFTKELILVAAARSSSLSVSSKLDESGDLRITTVVTADLRPDFGYVIVLIPRAGVKTINGKPIERA
jgi:hypothetical protein